MRLQGRRILVVDDEPQIVRLMKECFGKEGAEVDTAPDGAVALRLVILTRPDLVVMDLNMPDTNGFEAIASLRTACSDVPIVVLTGYGSHEIRRQAFDAGADEFLEKPVNLDLLVSRVVARLEANR